MIYPSLLLFNFEYFFFIPYKAEVKKQFWSAGNALPSKIYGVWELTSNILLVVLQTYFDKKKLILKEEIIDNSGSIKKYKNIFIYNFFSSYYIFLFFK